MKRHLVRLFPRPGAGLAALAALGLAAGADARAAAGPAAPVPVVVRVFEGDRFVPDLNLKDFVIEEGGLPLTPEALFLVRKSTIERWEGRTDVRPDPSRRIVLLFQFTEYEDKIPRALEFLFLKELLPTDTLDIQTPMHNYRLTAAALAAKPREVLARELTRIVRKDIIEGGMAYNSALRELKRYVRLIGGVGRTGLGDTEGEVSDGTSLEQQLIQYREHLQQMEALRLVEEKKLVGFAEGMKPLNGQKLVFLVYQREFRPEISPQTADLIVMSNQDRPDILADVETLFAGYRRPVNLNREPIIKAFADSGMTFNFLFVNRQPERILGITMREQSEDVFKALSDAANATGGMINTSQEADASLASALKASEASYVLYYTSAIAAPPGTFINLKVSVKGKDYRVAHRAGYSTGP
jgi:hypothetical protein